VPVNVVVIGDAVHMTMSVHDLSQSRMLEIVMSMLLLSRDHSAAVTTYILYGYM